MIVEHVRVYESPLGEVKITTDRAGWSEVADAVIRMHRARIKAGEKEAQAEFNRLVKLGLCTQKDRWCRRYLSRVYTEKERKHVKQLRRIRKRMRQGYCPYNRERFRLEDAYAQEAAYIQADKMLWIVKSIDGNDLLIPSGE